MLLVIDVGNTLVKMGLYKNKKLCLTSSVAANSNYTADQYAVEIKNILLLYEHLPKEVDGVIISSVVPQVGTNISLAVKRLFNIVPMIIGPGIKTGLNIKIDDPAQLGGDLVIGAVSAIAAYPLPALIFDFGTATKISVIGKNGTYLGCTITAGINMSIDALADKTASLPRITIEQPKCIIGTNSAESMKSGLIYGSAALIDSTAERIEEDLGMSATLIATGGLAGLICPNCKRKVILDENLLLEGLRLIYEKNTLRRGDH